MHILFHFVLKNKNKKWLLGKNNIFFLISKKKDKFKKTEQQWKTGHR